VNDHSPVRSLPDRSLEATRAATESRGVRDTALPYRPDIDGLRAIAVAVVIAYHGFPKLLTGGFIGVDIFFVISGYLITQLILTGLQAGTFSLGVFYQRRVRRILPALLVVLAACGVFGWFALLPTEMQWLGRSIGWCAAFVANVFFARTGGDYFDKAADLHPLLHLWSLGVEEQFYLVWPVLLMLAVKRGVALGVLVAVIATSLAISIWGAWYAPAPHFYLPAPRAWELAVGAILAARELGGRRTFVADALRSRTWYPMPQACSLAGLSLIAAGAVFLTAHLAIPGMWSIIPTAGAALFIGAGPLVPVNRKLLGNPPMVFVGRISYPLYLWHWPLFSFARIILGRPPPPAVMAGAVFLAFVGAYATYRLIEVPIRHGELSRKTVPVLLAALAGIALIGAAAGARRIPGRLTGPPFAAWDAAVTDWHYPAPSNIDRGSGFGMLTVKGHRDHTALFIGDSHIEQYWPRVKGIIDTHPDTARSAIFATYRGCPPLPGIETTWRGWNCRGFFEHAMVQALRPEVDTVVFGAFWEEYFLGEYPGDHAAQQVHGVRHRTLPPLELDTPGTRRAFEQFQQAITRLVSAGRRVFIVLSNPTSPLFEPVFPSGARLSLHVSQSVTYDRPRVDAGPFEAFVAPLTNRLRSIGAQTDARTVDPRLALCDGMVCPAAGPDGLPLYLDSNHLRGAFAREQASFVDEMLLGPEAQSRAALLP
jgi:peptidoglycan/LPS O-acetylase OafA/YrhL